MWGICCWIKGGRKPRYLVMWSDSEAWYFFAFKAWNLKMMNNLHFKSLDPGSMIDQYSERKKKNGKKNIYCCYFVLTGGSHAILIMKICTVSVKKKKKGKKILYSILWWQNELPAIFSQSHSIVFKSRVNGPCNHCFTAIGLMYVKWYLCNIAHC